MRIHISFQGVDKALKKSIRGLVRELAERLEGKLGTLAQHDVSLKGTLQKHGQKKDLYRFGATLHLLHRIIPADEEGSEPAALVRKVFDELERQAMRYKSRIRNEHEWKRKTRRKPLVDIAAPAGDTAAAAGDEAAINDPAEWFRQIRPHLDDLYDFARREITYLQAVDDLRPDDIRPDELVDAVLVTSWERRHDQPADLDLRAWLHQLAIDLLDQEVEASQQRRLAISTEEVIEDEDIDTDLYEFYQPDEVLKVEDLIGVPEQLPEIEAKQALLEQRQAQPALAQLPRSWRRAALLHHGAGFPVPVVAEILRSEVAAIEELLSIVARFLAERTDTLALPGGAQIERVLKLRAFSCPPELQQEQQQKFLPGPE
jgi:ribosome-associated translation inhibitor RaiA/DNA-directed RNA polymerase specialized sigma24 family protein